MRELLSSLTWRHVAAGAAVAAGLLLIEPRFPSFSISLIVGSVLAAWLSRRRAMDAVLYGVALIACILLIEPYAGPQLLACASLAFLALTRRPVFSLLAGVCVMSLLLFAIAMKSRFAGSVLSWQDVRYFFLQFNDNVGVMASQPTLVAYACGAMLGFAVLAVLAWRLDRPAGSGAAWIAGLALLVSAWSAYAIEDDAQLASRRPSWSLSEYSRTFPVATFFSTLHLEPRPDYRSVDTALFASEVQSARSAQAPGRLADIVMFLQESQFNPSAISGCPPSLCKLGTFEPSNRTTDQGELRVHTHGGGTWLSEFALATGMPHQLFGPAGDFAPFNVAPGINRSFMRSLKDAGYRTVAVYPVRGGMMNARMAYRAYGFDEFLDSDDLGLSGHFDTPDADMHAAALRALQSARTHGKPVFLIAVTIFNHSEHGVRMQRVPDELIRAARNAYPSPADADSLADYLWRTREFERAYSTTQAALLDSARPVVLAWFGDHQPPFGNAPGIRGAIEAAGGEAGPNVHHFTWYSVATNAPGPATRTTRRLDLVFLPGLLAQRAGVPLDDWLAANVVARERCGGLLVECSDANWRQRYLSYLMDKLHAIH